MNLKFKILSFTLLFFTLNVALCAVVLMSDAEEPPVTLEYHYKAGQMLHYHYDVSMKGTQGTPEGTEAKTPPSPEAPQSFSAKMTSRVTMETKKVEEDGSAWVDVRYDAFDVSQALDGKELPKGEEGSSPLKEMIGKTLSMHFQKDGKMLEMAQSEAMPKAPFQEVFGQMEGIFPDHPVRPGESWTKELQLPIEGASQRVAVTFQNTLDSFEKIGDRNCAKIKSVLTFSLPEGTVAPEGVEKKSLGISVKMEGQGKMEQYFDVTEGVVVKTEGTTTTTSTQSITVPATETEKSQALRHVSKMEMTFKTELE